MPNPPEIVAGLSEAQRETLARMAAISGRRKRLARQIGAHGGVLMSLYRKGLVECSIDNIGHNIWGITERGRHLLEHPNAD